MMGTHYAGTSTWGMAHREQGCQAWAVEVFYVGLRAGVSYAVQPNLWDQSPKLPGVGLSHSAPPSLLATS